MNDIYFYKHGLRAVLMALLIGSVSVAPSFAQDSEDPDEGFVQSLRSLYSEPDATSATIGFIQPGEYVRVEHVNALVFRVFRKGETEPAGFVVYPKLGPTSPLANAITPIRATSEEVASPQAEASTTARPSGEMKWVHNFANIRLRPNAGSAVVAQLPPGTAVLAGQDSGLWTLIYKQNETVLEPARALGYVHESLLKSSKPEPETGLASVSDPAAQRSENQGQSTATKSSSTKSQQLLSDGTERVNVNNASQRMLESLPRIGPVLAKRIIDYRESNGGFKRVDDLVKVKGIGDKTLERLRPYVTVGE